MTTALYRFRTRWNIESMRDWVGHLRGVHGCSPPMLVEVNTGQDIEVLLQVCMERDPDEFDVFVKDQSVGNLILERVDV